MANDVLRAEHDAVLTSLSTRDSTRQFAHAAVSFFGSVILFGTAGKLWWDFATENPEWWMTAAGLGAVVLTYSLTRAVLGFRLYSKERTQLGRLLELRRSLGLDAA
ncbi:MAG: hypothetical protein ACO1OB_14190 [Archangium sp.]